jgi:hypothetical protein
VDQEIGHLEWVPFRDEIIEEPDVDEVNSSLEDADIKVQCQIRFIQWSLREVYIAAGWKEVGGDLTTDHRAKLMDEPLPDGQQPRHIEFRWSIGSLYACQSSRSTTSP